MKKKFISLLAACALIAAPMAAMPVSAATTTMTAVPMTAAMEQNLKKCKFDTSSFWLMQCAANSSRQMKITGCSDQNILKPSFWSWSSSDTSVAKVDKNGKVTAVGTGGDYSKTCTIKASYGGYVLKATCKVFHIKRTNTYDKYDSTGVRVYLYEGLYSRGTAGGKAKYYAAHVWLKPAAYNKMHVAKAKGKRSSGFQTIYQMVHTNNNKAYNAILAVNGPFNGADSKKWNAFNDGKYYTASSHNYHEIFGGTYAAGTLGSANVTANATYSAKTGFLRPGTSQTGANGQTLKNAAAKSLISDTFHGDMGCTVLSNGAVQGTANGAGLRQRTFIGTNGSAGNFWIIVANGDNADSYSKGLNTYGEGEILKRLGCNYGYNLDGGGSSTMIFNGKTINKQVKLRTCYDALYVGR